MTQDFAAEAEVTAEEAEASLEKGLECGQAYAGNADSSVTILGKIGQYENLAKGTGFRWLNIQDSLWDSWIKYFPNDDRLWEVNKQFLDYAVAQGQKFFLASADWSGTYGREIYYLMSQCGYVPKGAWLVPGP